MDGNEWMDGYGGAPPCRPGHGGGRRYRRRVREMKMPGSIWEWSSARDFDPLPDLSFFYFGPPPFFFLPK